MRREVCWIQNHSIQKQIPLLVLAQCDTGIQWWQISSSRNHFDLRSGTRARKISRCHYHRPKTFKYSSIRYFNWMNHNKKDKRNHWAIELQWNITNNIQQTLLIEKSTLKVDEATTIFKWRRLLPRRITMFALILMTVAALPITPSFSPSNLLNCAKSWKNRGQWQETLASLLQRYIQFEIWSSIVSWFGWSPVTHFVIYSNLVLFSLFPVLHGL